jgi:ribonuclease PH
LGKDNANHSADGKKLFLHCAFQTPKLPPSHFPHNTSHQGNFMRPSHRRPDQLRAITLDIGVAKYAEGSCLVKFGDTHVLCTASVDERVPAFLKNTGLGWVTAEYGMLPRATAERTDREAAKGKQSGRTQEIQRLVGRSLRAITDRAKMAEIQIKLDCDVIQADGGTRTAAITGGYVALALACKHLQKIGRIKQSPLTDNVAAISCGLYNGTAVLDLDYAEDSNAQADANFVMTGAGGIVEIQGTAEQTPFSEQQFQELLQLARHGIMELTKLQQKVLA